MNKKILSQETLKIIACVTMLIDHIGAVFVPSMGNYYVYYGMRIIGRLAFPIYCFLLVEGAIHTSNRMKYAKRLLIFAFISEIPFDLAFFNHFVALEHQNVFFTLFLGLVCIMILESAPQYTVLCFVLAYVAELANTDYGMMGVIFIVLYYLQPILISRHEHWMKSIMLIC